MISVLYRGPAPTCAHLYLLVQVFKRSLTDFFCWLLRHTPRCSGVPQALCWESLLAGFRESDRRMPGLHLGQPRARQRPTITHTVKILFLVLLRWNTEPLSLTYPASAPSCSATSLVVLRCRQIFPHPHFHIRFWGTSESVGSASVEFTHSSLRALYSEQSPEVRDWSEQQ